jgi:hypothetical protein
MCVYNDLPLCHIIVSSSEEPMQISLAHPPPPLVVHSNQSISIRLFSDTVPLKATKLSVSYPQFIDQGTAAVEGARVRNSVADPRALELVVGEIVPQDERIVTIPLYTHAQAVGTELELTIHVSYCNATTNEAFVATLTVHLEYVVR